MNTTIKTVIFWAVIVVSAILLWQVVKSASVNPSVQRTPEISYSEFMSQVNVGNVVRVAITGTRAQGIYRDGTTFVVIVPTGQDQMLVTLQQKGVEIRYIDQSNTSATWWVNLAPLILLAVLWFYMVRRMQKKRSSTPGGPSATSNTPWPQN